MALLDAGVGLKGGFQDDEIKDPIAHDIFSYVKSCVNSALQTVRTYALRMNYLKKIEEHSNFLKDALRKLDPKNLENVKDLTMEAVQYKNAMLEYTKKHQSGVSRIFSKWVKEKGWAFDELVKRYQTKIGYNGLFKNLKEVEKLQVYEEIIEASGRGKAVINRLWTGLGVVGITVLLFTAGIMVWDIYSSEHKLETATRNTVQIASAVGGAMLGNVVAAALAPRLVGVVASSFFVGMMGIILGIAGAFILGAFTGWLVDLIFSSGSDQEFSTEGHRCYVARCLMERSLLVKLPIKIL
ncbi:hypothetical protein SLE2022_132820 [Rubroshorea leprosula]